MTQRKRNSSKKQARNQRTKSKSSDKQLLDAQSAWFESLIATLDVDHPATKNEEAMINAVDKELTETSMESYRLCRKLTQLYETNATWRADLDLMKFATTIRRLTLNYARAELVYKERRNLLLSYAIGALSDDPDDQVMTL